jgi:virginiamycin B lyase
VITEFLTPTFSFPIGITAGPDGNIWFAEGAAGSDGQIAFITPDGHIEEIVFSSSTAAASGIVTGPDGNIWFTQRFSLQIGKITPTGQFTFYPIPNTAEQITRGQGNGLLFTEFGSNKIAKITTDGVVTESPEIPNSGPTGIVAGPHRQVWFLGYAANRVYQIAIPR